MTEPLSHDSDENYIRFMTEALATGCVWGLEGDDGWALCPAHGSEAADVLPLWSQPEYAQPHIVNEWRDYKVIPIALEELLDDWLPGMHDDVLLVGPNWNADLKGDEVEPLDLLEDFDQAMKDV